MSDFPTHPILPMVLSINECEAGLRRAFPQIQWLFFEPDVKE